jgi:hypothetical protein
MSQGKSALGIVRKYHPNVTRVVDAKRDVEIEVTAEDCKAGKRKGPSSCAMACAFKREYDGAIISLSTAYLIKGDIAERYMVPSSVSREIVSFDRAKQFAPGDYSLKKPAKSNKLGPRRSRLLDSRHDKKYAGNKPRNHRTAGIRAL